MKVAVVVPLYNEELSINEFHFRVNAVISDFMKVNKEANFEIWYVNDGSTDNTQLILNELSDQNNSVNYIKFNRNFGQTYALKTGMSMNAEKDFVITLDGDLQHLPEEIPLFIKAIQESDADLVCGWRKNRAETFLRRFPSKVANRIIAWVTGLRIHDSGTTFRIIRGEFVKKLEIYSEFHRFLPALVYGLGGKVLEIPIKNVDRKFGSSKYGLSRTLGVLSDLILLFFIFKYADRPLRFFSKISFVLFTIVFSIFLYYFFAGLSSGNIQSYISERPGFFTIAILGFMLGVQLIFTGLILEYIIKKDGSVNPHFTSNSLIQ